MLNRLHHLVAFRREAHGETGNLSVWYQKDATMSYAFQVLILFSHFTYPCQPLCGNYSELVRDEQFAGLGEGIETLGSPCAKEGRQGHLAVGSLFGSSSAADLPTDDHVSQAPFRSVVLRRHVRVRYEHEQLFDEPLYASAELGLRRRLIV